MKIISKYKDFYDAFGYTYGEPDQSIVYLRTQDKININSAPNSFNKYKCGSYGYVRLLVNKAYEYCTDVEFITVGIYPYVYMVPFIPIYRNPSSTDMCRNIIIPSEIKPYAITADDIDNPNELYERIKNKFNNVYPNASLHISDIKQIPIYQSHKGIDAIKNKKFFEYDPNIFKELKAPVFVYTKGDVLSKILGDEFPQNIVINPIFNNYPFNVLGCCYDTVINEHDIYNNIESFLVESKLAKIEEPSNNTKIINAGFDLKTSFRNVK